MQLTKNQKIFFIIIILILIISIYFFKFYIYFLILFNRGIINPNKFWWSINDNFVTKHGFTNVLDKYRTGINYKNILGVNFKIINNLDEVKYILDNSPHKFKRGSVKNNFFKNLMPYNIGVTYDTNKWKELRRINEYVLDTTYFRSDLINELKDNIFQEINQFDKYDSPEKFIDLGKNITKLLVFGHTNVTNDIFSLIETPSILNLNFQKNKSKHEEWKKIIQNTEIKDLSLIGKLRKISNIDDTIIIDQIPHWIFPINGSISVSLPRILLLNYVNKNNNSLTRNKILESLRLFNTVITLFRLNEETQEESLIFIQMFLRDPKYFKDPHVYNPERWNNKKLEFEYYSLMFSQGPQICPGKNLILYLLEIMFEEIKDKFESTKNLDLNDLPDSLNPFDLF